MQLRRGLHENLTALARKQLLTPIAFLNAHTHMCECASVCVCECVRV